MSEKPDSGNESNSVNRRSILRQTAVGTTAVTSLSAIFGSVSAEEPTEDNAETIRNSTEIRRICAELGMDLPEKSDIEKRRLDDTGRATNGELLLRRVNAEYGYFLVFETKGEIGTLFNFDSDLDSAPDGYSMAKEQGGTIGVHDSEILYARPVTDEEKRSVIEAFETDGEIEGVRVQAMSSVGGYVANVAVRASGAQEAKNEVVAFEAGNAFDPGREENPNVTLTEVDSSEVETDVVGAILYDLLVEWVVTQVAGAAADVIGAECDESCTGCVSWIISMGLNCSRCGPVCSTSVSGMGAIVCVACVYSFCSDVLDMVDCSICMACVIEGEEPASTPNWWDVVDLLPSPPSWPL